jgi:hypothetical protein
MSEQVSRNNPRLENFEANKAAHEQAQYEQELYGEAGTTDFSDEAKKRVEEVDAYERHLESMTERGDDYDEIANNLEDESYTDAIDRRIAANPKLRRMEMIAKSIAEGYATEVTPENADRLPASIKDKEDKLQELLIELSDDPSIHQAEKDEIIERIINMSEGGVVSATSETVPDSKNQESTSERDDTSGEPGEEEAEKTDEVTEDPAQEGESLEEYEARHTAGIDPASVPEIDASAIPGHNSEKSGAGEEEPLREFNRGDKVRIQRTSGEVEDGWEVIDTYTNDEGEAMVTVGKDGVGIKQLSAESLAAMQDLELTPESDDESHEDEEDQTPEEEVELEEGEDIVESRWKTWAKRAKDAVNGALTKTYFGLGWTLNGLAKNERKEGETDEEYQERMKRNGRRIAVGITAVAVAFSAYKLYNGIESGSGGGAQTGGVVPELPHESHGTGNPANPHNELLNSTAWNIPEGSGGEALMDRLGVDKSVWYEHQNDFLQQFPDQAYRMPDGNVGFDNSGRLSKEAIDFWSQYAQK